MACSRATLSLLRLTIFKCDEARPLCSNCAKRYFRDGIRSCHYEEPRRSCPDAKSSEEQGWEYLQHTLGVSEPTSTTEIVGPEVEQPPIGHCRKRHPSTISLSNTSVCDTLLNDVSWQDNVGFDDWAGPFAETLALDAEHSFLATPCDQALAASQSVDTSDLQLYQHFISNVSRSMPFASTSTGSVIWLEDAPRLALRSLYLLEAVLAASALHMYHYGGKDNSQKALFLHHASAAEDAFKLHRNFSLNDGSETVLLTLVLLQMQLWPRRTLGRQQVVAQYEFPTKAIVFSKQLDEMISSTLRNPTDLRTRVHDLIAEHLMPSSSCTLLPSSQLHNAERYANLADMLFGLEAMSGPSSPASNPQYVLEQLVSDYDLMYSPESGDRRTFRALTALVRVLLPGVDSPQLSDPFQIAVFARLFAIIATCAGDTWWLAGSPESEVRGLAGLMPMAHSHLVDWPLRQIGNGP